MLNKFIVTYFLIVTSFLIVNSSYCQVDTIKIKSADNDSFSILFNSNMKFTVGKSALNQDIIEILSTDYDSTKVILYFQKSAVFYKKNNPNDSPDFLNFASTSFNYRIRRESDTVNISTQLWKSDSIMLTTISFRNGHLWYGTIIKEYKGHVISGIIINNHLNNIGQNYFNDLIIFLKNMKVEK